MFMKVCLFLHILGVYWEVGWGDGRGDYSGIDETFKLL